MYQTEKFQSFIQQNDFVGQDHVLTEFYDRLEPVAVDSILSRWRGGDFYTGHWGNAGLKAARWFGKWYRSPSDAKPLVCHDDHGHLFSNVSTGGEASLWEVAFRGKTSACMIYDAVPVFDHLRKVDDDTLFGIMVGKQMNGMPVNPDGKYYFFYLQRIEKFPVDFIEPDGTRIR